MEALSSEAARVADETDVEANEPQGKLRGPRSRDQGKGAQVGVYIPPCQSKAACLIKMPVPNAREVSRTLENHKGGGQCLYWFA